MSAYEIAAALSNNGVPEKNGQGYVCRCPAHDDKHNSMSVKDDGSGGVIVHCFTGCDYKDIKDKLRENGLLPDWKKEEKKIAKKEPVKVVEDEKKSFVWEKSKRGSDEIAKISAYLESRGITIKPPVCMKWNIHKESTMIACAASKPGDKEVYAVQRLFIDDGKKHDAKMLGLCEGRGVWFDRKADTKSVMIGEGVETVLSAIQATSRNGVAALSTSGVKNLILPDETEEIYILVDSDKINKVQEKVSMPGQKAAVALALRFVEGRDDRKAYLISPDGSCFTDLPNKLDFNDLLQADLTGESIRYRFEVAVDIRDLAWRPQVNSAILDDNEAGELARMFDRFVFLSSENKIIDTVGHDIKESMMIERAFTISQAGKFHRYEDEEGKDKVIPLSQHWLMSDEKKTASSLLYRPGAPMLFTNGDGRTHYNTFRFPYQLIAPMGAGEIEERIELWKLIVDTVFHRHVGYIEDWFSFSLQHPERRSGIMPICISNVGLGKSLVMAIMGKVVGSHNFSNAKILDVTGLGRSGNQWGDWIFNKKISCIEEINPEGESGISYKILDCLKDIITNETLALNLKGGRNGTFSVYSNIMGFSNHKDCIKIPKDDRRLFIVDSSGQKLLPQESYGDIWAWMREERNIIAVYQYLMGREIGRDFVPGQAKSTKAKRTMQMDGRNEMQIAFDMVLEQFPCDIITPGELKLSVAQALRLVKGDGDDDSVDDIQGFGNRDGQYNAIMKSTTTLIADGKRVTIARKKEEPKRGFLRAIRNGQRWSQATIDEIKLYSNMDIPLFWAKLDETENRPFSGQF